MGSRFAEMDRMFDAMHQDLGGGGFASMSSSSSSSSMKGGVSKSISTSTRVENGKKVSKTTTTIRYPDGVRHILYICIYDASGTHSAF